MIQNKNTYNNTTIIPAIIGATEAISKSLTQYLSNITGKNDIKELQNTSILCTAHTHTTGSANVKFHDMFRERSNIACSLNCKYRAAATLCILETRFVTGI